LRVFSLPLVDVCLLATALVVKNSSRVLSRPEPCLSQSQTQITFLILLAFARFSLCLLVSVVNKI
jgi:hypothetical protein